MKTSLGPSGLRIAGKAYEVRWYLRRMLAETDPCKPLAKHLHAPHPGSGHKS